MCSLFPAKEKLPYPLEMLAEESGASDESALVSLDFRAACQELDRHVRRSGNIVVSALGQRCENARCGQADFHSPVQAEAIALQLVGRHV